MTVGAITAPTLLAQHYDPESFSSGISSLDEWLKRRARANQAGGASRTYVITAGSRIIGYYCLSSGAIAAIEAPGRIRRNMPDPIPMAVLGRLAIDQNWQGRKIGSALLKDAVLRTAQAAEILAIRGLLVHAISEDDKAFYEHHGFIPSPSNPMTLMLPLKGIVA